MSHKVARTLAAIPYFTAVAEELHFGRAAARLGMTQPPLSRRIRDLESDLGVQLFRRTRHKTVLTDSGAALLKRCSSILQSIDDAISESRMAALGFAGQLRVGFVSSALYSVMPEIVREFGKLHPGVEVSLREVPTSSQIALLQRKEIDVGLLRAPAEDRSLRTVVALSERMVAVLPPHHPLIGKSSIHLSQLRESPFIMYARGAVPRLRDLVIRHCELAGFTPHVAQEAIQIPTIIAFVNAGLGVALIPEMATSAASSTNVVPLREKVTVELCVATLRTEDSPLLRSFSKVAIQVGRGAKTLSRSQ